MFSFGNADRSMLGLKEDENKYETDEYVIDIQSKNDSHSIIAREILKAKHKVKVLDVGCGSGVMGEFLKPYSNIIIDGIEIDEEAIQSLLEKKSYRHIISKSIEDFTIEELVTEFEKYDFIIVADLLEHLIDPINTLKKLSQLLTKDGNILISIPNVAHINIIEGLMNGNFNYSLTGILDTTHLRFFTLKSFAQMVDNMNQCGECKYDLKLIGTTSLLPSNVNPDSEFYNLLNQENHVNKLQYIFQLKMLSINEPSKELNKLLKKQSKNIYSELEEQFNQKIQFFYEFDNLLNSNLELNQKYNDLQKQYEELAQFTNQMVNSNSWKITKPLRKIRSIIGGSK